MTSLKTIGLGAVSALALMTATAANAADVYDGDGGLKDDPAPFYAPVGWTGFYVGLNLGATFDDSEDVEILDDGVLAGGGHLGYNLQMGNVVLGAEADVGAIEDVDALATLRGRLGFAFGDTLLYGTGGVAYIEFDEDDDTGYVVGGGLEHKIRENISFGVEGLYYGFEEDITDEEVNFWTARARLTYHINAPRPGLK